MVVQWFMRDLPAIVRRGALISVDTHMRGNGHGGSTDEQNQSYTAEFRTEAVRMVLEQGLSQAEVAARLGVPKGSLANWVVKAKGPSKPFSGVAEASREELQAEVVRLRRELARAEMEREIVKKAAAYFAKESLQGTRS